MAIHDLKIESEYFEEVITERKRFEVRKDDRCFNVGDLLFLRELKNKQYTGRQCKVIVTYILRDDRFVKPGFCIMSISMLWD